MLLNSLGYAIDYNKYNSHRARFGDTTSPDAQVAALQALGYNASWGDNGSLNEITSSLKDGKPVAIGIQHNSGSGHWILVTGVTANGDYIVNDPFGELVQTKNGGWKYTNRGKKNAGQGVVYSAQYLRSVFEDRGAGTGRILRIA